MERPQILRKVQASRQNVSIKTEFCQFESGVRSDLDLP